MIDITTWQERVAWDEDVDQPVNAASIDLRRDSGTTLSLAPYRTDSTLNRLDDGVTYSPLIYPGRKVTIEVATTAIGATIVAGDYKPMFEGTVESVAWQESPVSIRCRDRGGRLVDRWVQFAYKPVPGGDDLSVLVQTVYDGWVGSGSSVPFPETIYIPVAPSEFINEYLQQPMRVMDALQALAKVKAWDIRYKWDDGTSAFRLTLYEPPRSKTTPDYTFGPSDYLNITNLDIDRLGVRNWIEVQYPDIGPPKSRGGITVSDSTSITNFDLQYQLISEGDYSPITTGAQATALGNAVLSDLKDPKATHELETHFFWPAQLYDLYRQSSNGVHYNSNRDFAVVRIEHEISMRHHRTRIRARPTVAGGFHKWLPPPKPTPQPTFGGLYDPNTGALLLDPNTKRTTTNLGVPGTSIDAHTVGPTQTQARNRAQVYNSSDQTTANNTAFLMLWNSEFWDSNSLHSTSSNTSRITVPTGGNTGVWMLLAVISWTSNATGSRWVQFFKNGAALGVPSIVAPVSGTVTNQAYSVVDDAPAVGDYYEVKVTQTSGGNLDVFGSTGGSSFSAVHLW